jgi:hypothetical protein
MRLPSVGGEGGPCSSRKPEGRLVRARLPLILVSPSRWFVSIRGYFLPDGFCASFAQESLSVTVRLKIRCSDVLSLSKTK